MAAYEQHDHSHWTHARMKCVATTAVSFGDGHWYPVTNNGPARLSKPDKLDGYVRFHRRGTTRKAHRHFYEKIVGPIPEGTEPDHLCRDRACCAPAHLEPVTHMENSRRGANALREKTHCPQGHPYSGKNLIMSTQARGAQRRSCRTCQIEGKRLRRRAAGIKPKATTHCKHGHEFTPENTYLHPQHSGIGMARHCKKCATIRARQRRLPK